MHKDSQAKDICLFQVDRQVRVLYTNYLCALEDLRSLHQEMMDKISKIVPKERQNELAALDYFSDVRFQQLRKRTLDTGNTSIRHITEQLNQVQIDFFPYTS